MRGSFFKRTISKNVQVFTFFSFSARHPLTKTILNRFCSAESVRSRVQISPLLNKKDRRFACLSYLYGFDENTVKEFERIFCRVRRTFLWKKLCFWKENPQTRLTQKIQDNFSLAIFLLSRYCRCRLCEGKDEQGNITIAPLRTELRAVSAAIFDCTGALKRVIRRARLRMVDFS